MALKAALAAVSGLLALSGSAGSEELAPAAVLKPQPVKAAVAGLLSPTLPRYTPTSFQFHQLPAGSKAAVSQPASLAGLFSLGTRLVCPPVWFFESDGRPPFRLPGERGT